MTETALESSLTGSRATLDRVQTAASGARELPLKALIRMQLVVNAENLNKSSENASRVGGFFINLGIAGVNAYLLSKGIMPATHKTES